MEISNEEQESAEKEAERLKEILTDARRAWTGVRNAEEAKLSQRLEPMPG